MPRALRPAPALLPAYDRNDLTAPAFDIITDYGRMTSWGTGGAEWGRRIIEGCHARGGRVFAAWINPGPDFCGDDVASLPTAAE